MGTADDLLMRGTAIYYDETGLDPERFAAGLAERVKAERKFNTDAKSLEAGQVGEEWLAYIVFEALRRINAPGVRDKTFEAWAETVAGLRMDETPGESVPPPA